MQKRTFGKQGYDVSLLGMGCMRLPRVFDSDGNASVDKEKAIELIRYGADNGVNYFDTALTYHSQNSESVLGEALEGGYRQKVKIATKQMFAMMHTPDDLRRNLENTLKKLRTDYLDVYLIHNIQAPAWESIKQKNIIGEYEKLRQEGLIKTIGFSYHGGYQGFMNVLNHYDWGMCQVQQNLLDVDKETTQQAIIEAGKKGTALVIMEPLRGGGLVHAPENVQKIYGEAQIKREPVEWAFRHLIDYPQVTCILSGMTTLEQLKENISIFSKPDATPNCLSPKERDILSRAKKAYESIITIPCTACEYCLPCPQGVHIPNVFARYNEGMMFSNFEQPQRAYMFMERAGTDGGKCVSCGECEGKCPQNIQIVEKVRTAHEKLRGWTE